MHQYVVYSHPHGFVPLYDKAYSQSRMKNRRSRSDRFNIGNNNNGNNGNNSNNSSVGNDGEVVHFSVVLNCTNRGERTVDSCDDCVFQQQKVDIMNIDIITMVIVTIKNTIVHSN